jgi:CHASE2 domain-containing sensor protein
MVVQKYFLIFESGYSLNKLIVDTTFFAWIAMAGFAGGFVAALLAPSKNILCALMTGVAALAGILLFTLFSKNGDTWNALLGGVGLLLFSLIGGLIQQKIALSKYETI